MRQSATEGAGGLMRPVSRVKAYRRVFVLRKFHAARLFNDLIWWVMLPFTSVARVWPFWLVVGRCRVRISYFFLF